MPPEPLENQLSLSREVTPWGIFDDDFFIGQKKGENFSRLFKCCRQDPLANSAKFKVLYVKNSGLKLVTD